MVNQITPQEALDVLSLWTALEVLTYQKFRSPEDLVTNNSQASIFRWNKKLPWQNHREKAPAGKELFYEIVVGTIDVQVALTMLYEKYKDEESGEEFSAPEAKSLLATIVTDNKGCVVRVNVFDAEGDRTKVNALITASSFAWGVPKALNKDLKALESWLDKAKEVQDALNDILIKDDEDKKPIPLDLETINEVYEYLVTSFEIPEAMLTGQQFGIATHRSISSYRSDTQKDTAPDNTPQPSILNSFFLNDINTVQQLIKMDKCTSNLRKYIGLELPLAPVKLLDADGALEKNIAPQRFPAASWPSPYRHPLVMLQQVAVNVAAQELRDGGIMGINGPPGTGKTTLFRDIIASVVTERALRMLEYNNPTDAFTCTGKKVYYGQSNQYWEIYTLDPKLKGFEVLIASSNNKAVQNVSAELPGLGAIANDASHLRYFKCLSDKLLGSETWGLISAVLGNSSNRNSFGSNFWWDQETGIASYLEAIISQTKVMNIKNPSTGIREKKIPIIVQENDPPLNRNEAAANWKRACQDFKDLFERSSSTLEALGDLRDMIQELEKYEAEADPSYQVSDMIDKHLKLMPSFLKRLFMFREARVWSDELQRLTRWHNIKERVSSRSKELQPNIVNKELLGGCKEILHSMAPWCNTEVKILRHEVFIAAMKLHKAFIDGAAKPLHNNLGAFMQGFSTQKYKVEVRDFVPDLWSSFFLVVPSASTTFASAGKMLEHLPKESLGWLLIDEAGQATPQSALGAIMKAKRVVIAGDPMQLDPIVTLPDKLIKRLCEQFGVNKRRFVSPAASVQTLADTASLYFAEFSSTLGYRLAGIPLLIHRRCNNPMFNISNTIAYSGLMIHKKDSGDSSIVKHLGSSQWFNVESDVQSKDKWSEAEGEAVIKLLSVLKNQNVTPDLYIISPFRVVADNLREMIKKNKELTSWFELSYKLNERVGTVHTTQGREAEAVILVLGAQGGKLKSSREWVCATPNILNVAVTRAKEALYIVGNRGDWKNIKYFKNLCEEIKVLPL